MLLSILAFLVFVALFTLIFRYTTRVMGQRVGEWVDRRHRAAEEILDTGKPPAAWLEDLRSRYPGLGSGALSPGSERGVRRRLLREIRGLERYFERSPLVDSEETRRVLVEQLRETRQNWREAPVADLVEPAERSA